MPEGIKKIEIDFGQNEYFTGRDAHIVISFQAINDKQEELELEENFYIRWKYYNNPNHVDEISERRDKLCDCNNSPYPTYGSHNEKKETWRIDNCFSIQQQVIGFTTKKPKINESYIIEKENYQFYGIN